MVYYNCGRKHRVFQCVLIHDYIEKRAFMALFFVLKGLTMFQKCDIIYIE